MLSAVAHCSICLGLLQRILLLREILRLFLFNVGSAVVKYTVNNVVFDSIIETQLLKISSSDNFPKHIDGLGFHLVLGKGASLICADLVGAAHGLRGINTSNQAFFILHFTHGVRKGDRDSQGQTLRDCHDYNGDGHDQESHKLFNETNVVHWEAVRVFGQCWIAIVSQDKVEYQEFACENEEGKRSSYCADSTNNANDLVKLLLERRLALFIIVIGETKLLSSLARASPHTDSTD